MQLASFSDLQAAFLCKLGVVSADGAPPGTRSDRLSAAPPDSSCRAFSGNCIGAFDVPDRRKIPEADIIMETRKGVALSYAPEQVAV
jgi:hypothetical protein